MRLKLKDTSGVHEIDVQRNGEKVLIQFREKSFELIVNELPNAGFIMEHDDKVMRGYAVRRKDGIFLQIGGRYWNFQDVTQDDVTGGVADGEGDYEVVAPMPGSVIKLLVDEDQEVKRGQPLVIVEAMKMENEVRAAADGVVSKILVEPGQQVGFGEKLVELVPMNGAAETS